MSVYLIMIEDESEYSTHLARLRFLMGSVM
jgi:hypothetical protein